MKKQSKFALERMTKEGRFQPIQKKARQLLHLFALGLLFCLAETTANAQSDPITYFSYDGNAKTRDVTVPNGYKYLYVEAKGADGGYHYGSSVNIVPGGQGALVKGYFRVGTGTGQIPPGAKLRFIVGQEGGSNDDGGGGGGTGIAFKDGSGAWQILLVAGGGGGSGNGSYKDDNNGGGSGRADTGGSGGEGGQGDGHGGQGGYGYLASLSSSGEPVGINGKTSTFNNGGFGFGGGGGAYNSSGGGGGGYSGGKGGKTESESDYGGGEGGTSFVNTDPNLLIFKVVKTYGGTTSPENGYAAYQFTNTNPTPPIQLRANNAKCLDVDHAYTTNGTNIRLWDCNGSQAQQWIIDGSYIRLAKDEDKCLSLADANASNGSNIHLWDCKYVKHQRWFFDVKYQMMRSGANFNKCLDLKDGNTTDGTNIQVFDCSTSINKSAQQWNVEGKLKAMPSTTATDLEIHLVKSPDKCVDIDHAGQSNGTNVQLSACKDSDAQHFIFDGYFIKMVVAPNKCLSLKDNGDANGNNIHLWDCKKGTNQTWIYDGFAKVFRSDVNRNKCLSIADTDAHDGTNIHLWDCKDGNTNQQFEIY